MPKEYDLGLVNADEDLRYLAERLAKHSNERVGLLLHGPPGSGKSEYARYLAKRLDLTPLQRTAADLMSRYTGEAEKRIAETFNEARKKNRLVILDEADSYLFTREQATRRWEVTEVNELLTQLDKHTLPYICTTNLVDKLDNAAARRFVFHVGFRFLDEAGVHRNWSFFFGGQCPAAVSRLQRLVPADFARVRQHARILEFLDDRTRIVSRLERCGRDRNRTNRIGF